MKEKRKLKVEEQQKNLHLEYSRICEFVKIGIFYTKMSKCFATENQYQENVLEKIKEI